MKHWKFFPILVKIEVLKNMDQWEKLIFLNCSQKCSNLLSGIPNHLESLLIPYGSFIDDSLTLMTCRQSTIQKIKVKIQTDYEVDEVNQLLLKLNNVRNFLKVKEMIMEISPEHSEMYKKCIDFCDPNFIESIEIKSLNSQEIYEHILSTPQWKNSRNIRLNYGAWARRLEVNFDDFLHFKSIKLKVEELSADDAGKLVKAFFSNESKDDYIDISCRNPLQPDLIRQKIETELVGEWRGVGHYNDRYLVHPNNPNLVLEYTCRWTVFHVRFLPLEEFNMKLAELF